MINKISFIGAGSMSEAIIAGIVKQGFIAKENIFVTNRQNEARLTELHHTYGIQGVIDKEAVIDGADLIILSMKPYDLQAAIAEIKDYLQPNQVVISVIAGISTDTIGAFIGKDMPIIRTMPNTSAAVGFSATAIAMGKYATEAHLQASETLFNTIGTTTIVDEADMHAVTSISGSGPAYIYYMIEAMEKAAGEVGLEAAVAKDLIIQTLVGAGEMLKQSGTEAAVLRKNITSPGGTTQAGLETLAKHNFQDTVIDCVKSAYERSIEMGKN